METTSASSHIKEEAGVSFHSSSMVFSSDTGNATNDRSSLPKLPDESVQVDDTSSKIPESASPHMKAEAGVLLHSSPIILSSDTGSATYDRTSSPKFPKEHVKVADASPKFPKSARSHIRAEAGAAKQFSGTKLRSSSMVLSSDTGNATFDRAYSPKFTEEHIMVDASSKIPESIKQFNKKNMTDGALVKSLSSASHNPVVLQSNIESSSHYQATQEDSMSQENGSKGQRHYKDSPEKINSVSNIGILGDKEKIENKEKGQEEQNAMRNKHVEKEILHNLSKDDSPMKGKLRSGTLPLSRKSHEQPTSVLVNDKPDDQTTFTLPLDSTKGYGLLSKNQAEEISTLKDDHVGVACHSGTKTKDSFPDIRTELKSEVQMLREELREAAALEVSLYSIVAEHGSSANKVHAPARRLSRFYFHACRIRSSAARASAAQSAISGFVLVSKACGNDVPRLTFWLSNLILLRAIISRGVEKIRLDDSLCINSQCDGNGSVEGSSLKRPSLPHEEEKENTVKHVHGWEDPQTFLFALEKIEAWIFSRIIESVWWQTLTPHMQSAAAKSSSSRKTYGRKHILGDQEQGSISIELWISAFKDACERLCPLRAGGHGCGCLPVIARLVMEQLLNRLDVAMFNAILRESAEEMPTDPISDPICDSKVLPIPAGKSGFGAGVQLKNAIGNWSRWLSDLFDIDDSDSPEDRNENDGNKSPQCETSFKAFPLLHSLSDLMMLPFEMLADGSQRKEVCPTFGVPLIKRVLNNFVPDEFCPGAIPDAVLEALDNEETQDDDGSISSFPRIAAPAFYAPPPATSVMGIIQEVGAHTSVVKKSYTSDDELDDLDSPLPAIGIDDPSLAYKFTAVTEGRNATRYELLREVWKESE